MIINGIDTKDISVVVQGAVDRQHTPVCLESIRKILPGSEIILSTWEDCDVSNLDYDVLVESKDPGSVFMDDVFHVKNNVNRQILSTKNGLKKTNRLYAIKIRSDMCVVGTQFLRLFTMFPERNDSCKFLRKRVVIDNLYCANPYKTNFCFHVSDWFFFGLREDLLNIFDIDLQVDSENDSFFTGTNRPKLDPIPTWKFRYIPEQYIWISFLKKNGLEFKFDYFTDISNYNIMVTELSFANNLIISDYEESGVKFLKFNPYKFDYTAQYRFNDWLGLYRKYCLYDKETVDIVDGNTQKNKEPFYIMKILLRPMRPLVRILLKRPLVLLRRFWDWCG